MESSKKYLKYAATDISDKKQVRIDLLFERVQDIFVFASEDARRLLKENFSPSGEESEEEAKEKDEVVGDLEQKFLAEREEKTKGGPAGKAAVDPVPSFSAGLKGKPCRSEDTTLSSRMTRSLGFRRSETL